MDILSNINKMSFMGHAAEEDRRNDAFNATLSTDLLDF